MCSDGLFAAIVRFDTNVAFVLFSDVAVPANICGDPSLSTWEGWGTETWVGAKGQEMLNFLPASDLGSLFHLSSRTFPNS